MKGAGRKGSQAEEHDQAHSAWATHHKHKPSLDMSWLSAWSWAWPQLTHAGGTKHHEISFEHKVVNVWFVFLRGFILIRLLCVCVSVYPLCDLGNRTSYCHTFFTSVKSFAWWVPQTAWWVLYSNIQWRMCRLLLLVVSTCDIQNHAHLLRYRIHCS